MPKIKLLPDLTGQVSILFSTYFPDGIPVLEPVEFDDSVKPGYLKEMPELTPDDLKVFAFDWAAVGEGELLREFGKIINRYDLKIDDLILDGPPCFVRWHIAEVIEDA